ncbi:MAG TPA: DinB family protein [Humibacillus xanthopallidus]|nr:DinB family protein [Humibacillus xanthopallidus]
MPLSAEARARLEWIRDDYVALVRSAAPCELLAPSDGTKWTNRELLFHMWFGQRIARALIPVMGAFSQVPPSVSQAYAGMLSAATRPYTWVNYAAAVGGARAAGLERAERWMIADTAWLLRWAGRASDADLARGMSVPPGWDPYFTPWMSRADVMDWLPKHYQHHRAQLTLGR